METVENETFDSTSVVVDGKQFTNCTFHDVSLVYSGGDVPRFVDCEFTRVSLAFDDAAAQTMYFLRGMRKSNFGPAVDRMVATIRNESV